MFEMFPQLEVVDGFDREGAEVLSEEDEDEEYGEDYGEEGEEGEGEFVEEDNLDAEIRKKYRE